ncbi:hypothetical protein ['Camptotheca acuminata' phytoplasma]|uniref:hypothetical protein n=1 Tax='Camptotheca acuminata' phytoplasma TaxID=3239192 RepID=UPI00351A9C01
MQNENHKTKIAFTLIKSLFFLLISMVLIFFNTKSFNIFGADIKFANVLLGVLIFFINYLLVFKNFKKNSGFIKFLFLVENFLFNLISLGFIFNFLLPKEGWISNIFQTNFMIYYILIIHSIIKLYIAFYSNKSKNIINSLEFIVHLFLLSANFYLLGSKTDIFDIIQKILGILFLLFFVFHLFVLFMQFNSLSKNKSNKGNNIQKDTNINNNEISN